MIGALVLRRKHKEDPMRHFVLVAALGVAFILSATGADARSYRYCLKSSVGPGDCKYNSYRQCQAALSGTTGTCVRNSGPRR